MKLRASILRESHTCAYVHIRMHTVVFRVIRALQRLIASLPIIRSALDSMACLVINGRPCYIIGVGRPAFRDIVQGQRREDGASSPCRRGEKG